MNNLYLNYFLVFLLCGFVSCDLKHNSVLKLFKILNISNAHVLQFYNVGKLENSKYSTNITNLNNSDWLSVNNILSSTQRKCIKDIWYILKNLQSQWAIQMLDANGKLPSGILLGNFLWIGKYDECTNVQVPDKKNGSGGFHGMYCLVQWNMSVPSRIHLPIQEVPIKTGVCLPSSCYNVDMKKDIKHVIDFLYNVSVTHFQDDVKFASINCRETNSHLNLSGILFLCFLGIYLFLSVAGSFVTIIKYFMKYDNYKVSLGKQLISVISPVSSESHYTSDGESAMYFEREECADDQTEFIQKHTAKNAVKISSWKNVGILKKIGNVLKCFCIFSNSAQILTSNSSKKQFLFLHGLRFFSMTWVILGHTYVHNIDYIDNYMDLLKGIDSLPFQTVIQGTFSVDSFFLIGGFLLGYLYLKEADKRNGKINWFGLCLHRFIRITPVYIILIAFTTLVFKHLGSGPFWEDTADVVTCKQYWWWNVLYINNFLPMNSMCLTWTWYLANDMQFFIINSLILYILWRWKYVGVGIFCFLLVSSWMITGYLSYIYNILPLFVGIANVKNYTEYQEKLILAWDTLYSKPYCRIGPHIIGILLAYLMHTKIDRKFSMNKWAQIAGWIIALFCSTSVIYGLYHVKTNSTLLHAYNALGRSTFSLGVAWLVFCCFTGYAGFINDFLSYKLWIPLSRLTYCAYLFHPLIMNWYFQLQKVPLFFSHITMVTLFFSFLFMSYGMAFIISVIFEAPLINLERLIFKK